MTESDFASAIERAKAGLEDIIADERAVRITAERLRLHHYSPLLGPWDAPLSTMSYRDILREIDLVAGAPAEHVGFNADEIRANTFARRLEIVRLMCDQYQLIQRLREDDTDAWDTIHEMYFDD